jgi:hypothetical protein
MDAMKLWAKKAKLIIARCDGRSRLVALFVIGALVGAVVKYQAEAYVTIGYEDYKVEEMRQGFDYQAMTVSIVKKRNAEAAQGSGGGVAGAGVCGI